MSTVHFELTAITDFKKEDGLMISGKSCLLENTTLVWKPEYQKIRIVNGQVRSLLDMCIPIVRNYHDVQKVNVPQELKAKLIEVSNFMRMIIDNYRRSFHLNLKYAKDSLLPTIKWVFPTDFTYHIN